ncbi:MAG: F0F1 ATP synthase subunit delta [Kiloniellales bacterium]
MASGATGLAEIAGRYATALFELADQQKALDRVADDLRRLKAMLAQSAALRRLVRSPVVSRAEQGKALMVLMERAGFDTLSRRFVGLVAANRRLFALGAMIDAYLAELASRRGEITAQVTAASALSEAQQKALATAVKRAIGGRIALQHDVDPSILGGLVVRVGSRMVDSSLGTKLRKLGLAMKGAH